MERIRLIVFRPNDKQLLVSKYTLLHLRPCFIYVYMCVCVCVCVYAIKQKIKLLLLTTDMARIIHTTSIPNAV